MWTFSKYYNKIMLWYFDENIYCVHKQKHPSKKWKESWDTVAVKSDKLDTEADLKPGILIKKHICLKESWLDNNVGFYDSIILC